MTDFKRRVLLRHLSKQRVSERFPGGVIRLFLCPQLLDMKVFVDTDSDIRLVRRLKRDITARGRDIDGVIRQYNRFVKPSFEQYIEPTVQLADIVVPRGQSTAEPTVQLTSYPDAISTRYHFCYHFCFVDPVILLFSDGCCNKPATFQHVNLNTFLVILYIFVVPLYCRWYVNNKDHHMDLTAGVIGHVGTRS